MNLLTINKWLPLGVRDLVRDTVDENSRKKTSGGECTKRFVRKDYLSLATFANVTFANAISRHLFLHEPCTCTERYIVRET